MALVSLSCSFSAFRSRLGGAVGAVGDGTAAKGLCAGFVPVAAVAGAAGGRAAAAGVSSAGATDFFFVSMAVGAAATLVAVDERRGVAAAEAPVPDSGAVGCGTCAAGSGRVGSCVVTMSDKGTVEGCGAATSGNGAIGVAGAMAAQPAKSGNSTKTI